MVKGKRSKTHKIKPHKKGAKSKHKTKSENKDLDKSSHDDLLADSNNIPEGEDGKKGRTGEPKSSNFYSKLNGVLVILIIILASIFSYRMIYLWDQGDNDNGGSPPPPPPDETLTVASIIPAREAGAINCHEHIQDLGQAPKWLSAMDEVNVSTTIILGSPDATYILHPTGRFNKYKENNEELMKMVDAYPNRFIAFPTIYTYDENKLDLLKSYITRGAVGLKLFTGHYASFHDVLGPLNHSTMFPVYKYCEDNRIPIIWHVHLGIDVIREEFEDVLARYPKLIITIPHFGLSSIKISRLEYFLDTYPNLYTDISFGYWAKAGLWRLSNYSAFYAEKLIKYQDRFQFGTDMVCTEHPRKSVEWIANLTQGYRDILEKKYFNLTVHPDIEGDFNGDNPGLFNGMALPQSVLDKIYYDNVVKFICGRYYYENLSDVLNQTDLKVEDRDTRGQNFDADTIKHDAQSYLLLSVTERTKVL